MEINYQS